MPFEGLSLPLSGTCLQIHQQAACGKSTPVISLRRCPERCWLRWPKIWSFCECLQFCDPWRWIYTWSNLPLRFDAKLDQLSVIKPPFQQKSREHLPPALERGQSPISNVVPHLYQQARLSSRPIFTLSELRTERSVPWQTCKHEPSSLNDMPHNRLNRPLEINPPCPTSSKTYLKFPSPSQNFPHLNPGQVGAQVPEQSDAYQSLPPGFQRKNQWLPANPSSVASHSPPTCSVGSTAAQVWPQLSSRQTSAL